ncbi:UDP-phosphate glycosyltransferase [Pseudactinotalea sp. Z1732]|uniref:UDP-phosphate glycosyltransferase n=1 Tax=Pseudactinotalea sp. Z1732 TaxID=3413026 RepID=UPI003C7BDF1A
MVEAGGDRNLIGVLAGGAGAALAGAGLTWVLIRVLHHFGVVDAPVARSLHHQPVARGGGLAVLVALGIGMLVGATLGSGYHAMGAAWLLASTVLYGALGFNDDLTSLSARFRFAIQVVLGFLVALVGTILTGWSPVWALFAAGALLVAVNVTNFMDGANGLVSTHTVVTGLWFAILALSADSPTTALFSASLAGAALGFLPFNAVAPKIFLGDVGSYAIGAALTAAALVLAGNGVPLAPLLAPFLVYLLDTAYTLQLRIRAGERWYEPHKLHIYQRLITAGWSHPRVAGTVSTVAAAMCVLTLPMLLGAPVALQVVTAVLILAVAGAYLRLPVWAAAPVPWRKAAP